MHWSPCKGNKLMSAPEKYVHSSAKFYIWRYKVLSGYFFYGAGGYGLERYFIVVTA
jgi:hypothetical protein